MAIRGDRDGRVLLFGTGLLLAYAAARVLQPQILVLAAAAVVAVVVHPFYARLLARMPGRPHLAAAVATVAVCILLAVPLVVGGWYSIRESIHALPLLRERIQALSGPAESPPSWVPPWASEFIQELDPWSLLIENIREIGAWFGRFVRSTAGDAVAVMLNGAVFALCLHLFLRDGRGILARLISAVPLEPKSKAAIVEKAHDMIIATIQGVFAVAVLQGLLSAAGFALVVGTADNILRPLLIGSRSRLPAAIAAVGVLGGLRAFGAMGIFIGPVIMAIAVAAVDILVLSPDPHGADRG